MSISKQSSWLEGEDGTPIPLEGGAEKRFGRYVLSRRIASGGMGTVYLARAVGPGGFDLPVAIKVIHPHLARRQDLIEMFLDEARITAQIRHPNVCSVLDFGETDGTWFLAMEYLLGETLSSVIGHLSAQEGAMDDPRYRAIAMRILADACEGLHAAHELTDSAGRPMNVVHRDVSPHNLLVTYDGAVKVLDFGIALAKDRVHQTTTGGLKGKYAYMPPEQLKKQPLDRRSDVWSLGVCLWEVLTGKRLFRRESEMDTLLAVRGDPVPPPSEIRPSIPRTLDPIVLSALERDPDRRMSSARELGRALSAWLRIQPEPHGMVETAEWMGRLFEKRRAHKTEVVRTVMSTGVVPVVPEAATRELAGPARDGSPMARVGEGTASLPSPVVGRIGMVTDTVSLPPASSGAVTAEIASGPSPAIATAPPPPPRRARPSMYLALGAALVLSLMAGSAGIGMWLAGGDDDGAGLTVDPTPDAVTVDPTPDVVGVVAGDPEPEPALQPAPEPEPEPDFAPESDLVFVLEEPEARRSAMMRRPRMTAVTGRGTVNVVTPGGWAEVYVAGRPYGRTPRRLELPAGQHTIELLPFGRTPAIRVPTTVRAREATRVVRAVTR